MILRFVFQYGLFSLLMLFALEGRSCSIDSYNLLQPSCLYSNDGSLTINASGAAGFEYSIDGGQTFTSSSVFNGLAPGTYIVVVQSPQPCSATDTVYIAPASMLSASGVVSATSVFAGQAVTFLDQSYGHTTTTVVFGDGTDTTGVSSVTHTYSDTGTHAAMIIVSDGICSDTVFFTIAVFGNSSLLIPNVFSPNDDDINDLFMPRALGMKDLEGVIMNRYGQIVHSWIGVNGFWDGYSFPAGVACSEGTYYYWIKANGLDGVAYDQKGTITLLR